MVTIKFFFLKFLWVFVDLLRSQNVRFCWDILYIHFSIPSKNMMLVDIQEKLGVKNTKLCSISDTRWSCRFKNYKMVMEHYSSIIKVLKCEINANNDKNVANFIDYL